MTDPAFSLHASESVIISQKPDRRTPSQERVIKDVTNHAAFQARPGFKGKLADLTAFVHIAVHTTAAVYRHQESRLPAKFGPWSHDWRRYARRRTGDDDDVVSDDESLEVLFGIRSRAELEASRAAGDVSAMDVSESEDSDSVVDLTYPAQ